MSSKVLQFYSTTVGKKIVMALSGLALVGFVIAHMLGNLKIFFGKNLLTGKYKFDEYAEFLREMGEHLVGHGNLLWIARAILLVCVVLHMMSGIQLARLNARAKPVKTTNPNYRSSNAASRTMLYGGLFLILFIVYHILHFTTGTVHYRGFVEGAVYSNVVLGFQSVPVASFYIFAMACLALHLYHGTWSMFQTLGVDSPVWNNSIRLAAKIVAFIVFLGFCSLPISVLLGVLAPPS